MIQFLGGSSGCNILCIEPDLITHFVCRGMLTMDIIETCHIISCCYGCNTKSTRYSCYSGNVPGLHILLRVELLTPFTSGIPFLLCSSFVLTLLIRKHCLVVLSFHSIVLHSQTHLRSKLRTPCYVPFLVIVLVVPHNRLIIFPFCRYIHSHGYIYKQVMYDRITSYIDHSAPFCANL